MLSDATKPRRGRPRLPDGERFQPRTVKLHPSTIFAMDADDRTPDQIMRAGLGL